MCQFRCIMLYRCSPSRSQDRHHSYRRRSRSHSPRPKRSPSHSPLPGRTYSCSPRPRIRSKSPEPHHHEKKTSSSEKIKYGLTPYSKTSKQRMLWGQYKFRCCVLCREVLRGSKCTENIQTLKVSSVQRSVVLCPYLGGSIIGGFTVIEKRWFGPKVGRQYGYSDNQ